MMMHSAAQQFDTMDPIHWETELVIAIVACASLAIAMAALVVFLSRPSHRLPKKNSVGRHGERSSRTIWHERINSVVARHAAGEIDREEAFAQLAAIAREYASEITGADVRTQTLTDISSLPQTTGNGQGLVLLRQTIGALYPPEFADAEHNHTARSTTVEQAGEWVSALVERWR